MKIFGNKQEGVNYFVRKGAYVIAFNHNRHKIALIRANKTQYFLPGGGVENGEDTLETLRRELLEECGYTLKNMQFLCRAQRYFMSTLPIVRPMLSDGYFYTASLSERVQDATEIDNHLEWIDLDDIEGLLFHEHQYYAIEQAIKRYL